MSRGLVAVVVATAFGAAFAAPVLGAPPGPVQASIAQQATLVDGGAAVLVDVTVACAGGSDVLEAFVYVSQDGAQSPFTGIAVRCGGRPRTYTVSVPAPSGGAFRAGSATASAFVLADRRGDVTSSSPGATLTVQ